MADDGQQPGPSQIKQEPVTQTKTEPLENDDQTESKDIKPVVTDPKGSGKEATSSTDGQAGQQNQEQKSPLKGRKRKLSAKSSNFNKRNSKEEEDLEAEKLKFLLEPILRALRRLQNGNESETMRTLLATLQPTQKEIDSALHKVKLDLDCLLGFPNNSFVIYEFGSIKSGLAFRDSDLDFYIHYDKNSDSKQDQGKLLHVIHSRMMRAKTFHSMVKILGAKVPLLRAVHGPTNLTCDINFSNARGCYNSKFIYAVTRFDHRIHKLAIIVKFWSKCAYLLNNHRQMNTYCIIMMLIFYLQTKKLPLLPSVQDLQKGIPRVNYGPWNLGYPKDIEFQTMNRESIRQLLTNFFKYYAEFNFHENLISPYVGRLCTIEEMKQQKVRELQTYYRAEQQNYPLFNYGTLISIQDPFELNMNIGGVCSSVAYFEQLKVSFKAAHEACLQSAMDPFAKVLEAVFTKTVRHTKASTQKPIKAQTTPAATPAELPPLQSNASWRLIRIPPIENELFLVRQILQTNSDKDVITDLQVKDMWGDCLMDFIGDILEKIYLCQVTPDENAERAATIPANVRTENIRTFQLSCKRQVILKRPRIQIDNEADLNREIAISKARWEADKAMVFDARVDMFKTPDAIEIHLDITKLSNGMLRSFVNTCFLTQIRSCIRGYLKVMFAKAENRTRGVKEEPAA